jgi:thiol-disulfide isomerase/thioredoxin
MTSKPIWIIIISVAIIAMVTFYNMMQPPMTSVGPGVNGSAANTVSIGLTPGRVTMINLGATECVPCKMMAPILEELKEQYAGKADIIFIDVWKDSNQAKNSAFGPYRPRYFLTQKARSFTVVPDLWTKNALSIF